LSGAQITGTPTTSGTANFTVTVTDSNSATDSQALSIKIAPPPVTITTASLANGQVGAAYSQQLQGSGGTGTYTWSITTGALPSGLTMNSSGLISGTATASGTANFTVKAADTTGSATKALSINVTPNPVIITTASLPNGQVGIAYSQQLQGSGGTGTYTWSITAGALPTGLTMDATGLISGTPTASGPANFTVKAADITGSATKALSITIASNPIAITTTSLPNGQVGTAYSQKLQATGGTGTYTWSITTGALSAGLTMDATGLISGTPTASGTANFTVKAADSSGSATKALSITVTPAPVSITVTSLSNGQVGAAYTQALQATGGTGTYTWSITTGALPAGLTLSSGGQITGTPTTAGTSNFTVKAADTASGSATQALSITVAAAAVNITTTSLPAGQVGTAYTQALQATGGTGTYTWSITTGALPAGLTLGAASGQITGSPTTTGTSNFTVKAADTGSGSATQALSITIGASAVSITTTSLPSGQVGTAYSQTLGATGGTGTYTWSITAGALPPGLMLSSGGQITGSPTTTGTSNFTVKAADSGSGSATQALSITIAAAAVGITTTSLPNGQVGTAYSQALAATGGTGTYTWSLASGTLPTGLALSGSGQITGTPTAAGPFNFSVKAADTGSGSATQALSITITAAAIPVTISTSSLPGGQAGIPYSQALQASGGTAPYTWGVSSGSLPAGLTLSSSGQIAGTPTAAANASFTVRVTDSAPGSAQGSATAPLSITIAGALTAAVCPATSGTVGQPFSMGLTAAGGTPPYTWSVGSGQLPGGLSLSAAGQIQGTPSAAGSFSVGAKVTDQNSATASTTCSITINPAAPALSITTASLADGINGTAYTATLGASGGQTPYAWSVSSGGLPPGLALAGSQISGTPSAEGTFPFTIRATDNAGGSATKDFSIRVGPALTIVTTSLSTAKTGTALSQQLSATGGDPPYSWALAAGGLPAGVTLAPSGAISGTPTGAGNSTFTVRVTDAVKATADRTFTFLVTAALAVTSCPAPNANQGQSYTSSASATGGQTPYTWTIAAGGLPTGIVFDSSSGAFTGNPSDIGTYSFTLLVTDKAGATATRDCQLVVASALSITTLVLGDASPSGTYSQTLTASGGKTPYSWTLTAGTLPNGLALSGAGIISGTPLQVGSFPFAISVTDANRTTVQKAFTINVVFGLVISGCPVSTAEVGVAFNSQTNAVGGTPPYTWTITVGALPSGLTIDSVSGAISGTPSQAGQVQFTLNARDMNLTANKQCSIDIRPALSVSTTTLGAGTSGSKYSDSLSAAGGAGPFVWSTTAGSLPPGLSLNPATGQITGMPLVAGAFTFTAKVIDSIGGQGSKDLTITIAQGLTIGDCPTPTATIGQNYSSVLSVVGGTAPFVWKIDSGALPPGLALSSDNASISGVPTQQGAFTYTLRLNDSTATSTTRLCSIQVNAATLTITSTAALANAILGTAYSQTLTATGGRGPYAWSITSAGAPDGLSFSSGGVLTGIPTTPGNYSFTVQVTDQDNNVSRQTVTLVILAGKAPALTLTGLTDIVDPAQQPVFALQLDSAYPAPISGTVTLVFTPDPAVGVDDPAVQFASGGRALKFTVASGSTQVVWAAPIAAFQSGTVAGTIQFNVQMQSSGTDITPSTPLLRTVRVDRLAPRIVSATVTRTSTGFDVHIIGFATTREVTQGVFQFSSDSSGAPAALTVPLDGASKTWFQDAGSAKYGSQFGLVESFQWQGTPTTTLNSLSVSLTNAQGTSAATQVKF
jgi:hypothetical protein